jgi:tetratricopeptide (TPR) repeat protein
LSTGRAHTPALPDAPVAPRNDGSGVRLVIDPSGNGPADSLFRLAYAEQMKSNLDGAQALYEKAIATRRAPAEAYNDYGVLLLARGNKSAATEMFRQALNHDDKNVEAWVNLGDSFNGMGYHAEAMSAYARANQLDPSRPAVKARISREYEAIGDTASARRYLEDAVKASPNDAPAHYALGAYLQRARDFPGAIREFQAFVDLSAAQDNQEFVVEMRRHINTLKRVAP